MHPSLLTLAVALGTLAQTSAAETSGSIAFKPAHDAFLLVRHPDTGEVHFSRGGVFHIDAEGRFVGDANMPLVTLEKRPTPGEVAWTDLRLPIENLQSPRASANIGLRGNLDPYAALLNFDPHHPSISANAATHTTVYDAQGGAHRLSIYFNAAGLTETQVRYRWVAMIDPEDLQDPNLLTLPEPELATDANVDIQASANPNTASQQPNAPQGIPRDVFGRVGQGEIAFHQNGTLLQIIGAKSSLLKVQFANLPEPQSIKLNFGKPVDLRHNGRDGVTAFAHAAKPLSITQDGYHTRRLTTLSDLDAQGLATATLSDGTSLALPTLVMAQFYDMYALQPVAGEIVAANEASGAPNLSVATCADVRTWVLGDDGEAPEDDTDTCPLRPSPWQKVLAAPGAYFVLEGKHAGREGKYLAQEIDLQLVAGAPLQEDREGLSLRAAMPSSLVGDANLAPTQGELVIPLPTDLLGPKMTTSMVLTGNLDASNPPRTMDPYHLQSSANISVQMPVYDYAGAAHQVRFDFYAQEKVSVANAVFSRYLWLATFDPDTAQNERELDASIADGLLTFDPNGALKGPLTTTLSLPLGQGGEEVVQTVYFGEPPDPVDPNAVNNPNATGNPNAAGDPNAAGNPNAANPQTGAGSEDPNALEDVPQKVLPAPLTSLPRASRMSDFYQDGWQPTLADFSYGIDTCGRLTVGLPTDERLLLGTVTLVKKLNHPLKPLNDWLYAWPSDGDAAAQEAVCDDILFPDIAEAPQSGTDPNVLDATKSRRPHKLPSVRLAQ